eukprot:Em0001g3009a
MFRPQIAEPPILGMKILYSAGIYTGDEDASDQNLFVVERKTFKSLCSSLVQQCGCLSNPFWTIASFIKKGHVARVQFVCPHCKQSRVWASCRVLSGHYLANQKLVHAVTCAGMLPRQYMNFALFAGMGVVKQKYIISVYLNQFYQQVVADVAEESMKLLQQHRVAQTREVACTKIVLPQVIARGLNITEVAHDYQATIKLYVRQLGMVNSYDTWHGTKNVAKQLRHICAGTVRTRDRTWFTELSDKARCTKVHLYWCMRNCGGNPDRLRAMIMNISKHFQCRDTYWVESFNHQLLTYLPKRIHFHTKTFEMRIRSFCYTSFYFLIAIIAKLVMKSVDLLVPYYLKSHHIQSMTFAIEAAIHALASIGHKMVPRFVVSLKLSSSVADIQNTMLAPAVKYIGC